MAGVAEAVSGVCGSWARWWAGARGPAVKWGVGCIVLQKGWARIIRAGMIGINRPPRPSILSPAAVSHPMSDEQDLLSWVPRLRRYARVLRHDADEADDLVRDTLDVRGRARVVAGGD